MAWMASVKIFLISSGVLFVALAMKVSVPLALEFLGCHVPLMWSLMVTWLRPPYLFLIINGIIITIAASSRFHHHQNGPAPEKPGPTTNVSGENSGHQHQVPDPVVLYEQQRDDDHEEPTVTEEVKTIVVTSETDPDDDNDGDADELVINSMSPRVAETGRIEYHSPEIILPAAEKPLLSSRFGHRKPVKPSPEGGRLLKVAKPKRPETLENTWKAITEGRSMPLSRHLKKCETWENHGRYINVVGGEVEPSQSVTQMKKSDTFKDQTNQQLPPHHLMMSSSPAPPSKLRKEPSLSQDELNRRVEAFIQKFNEEMRLQRQESLKQYMEMINRGSH